MIGIIFDDSVHSLKAYFFNITYNVSLILEMKDFILLKTLRPLEFI